MGGLGVKFLIRFAHKNFLPGLACFGILSSRNIAPTFKSPTKAKQFAFSSPPTIKAPQGGQCFVGGDAEI